MKFGILKSKIEDTLMESYKSKTFKKEIKNFKPSAAPLPNYNTDKPGQVDCSDRPPRWEKQPRNPVAGK